MSAERFKRKLAAILSADVKGYSRLMGEDENGTVCTLNVYKKVMTGLIQDHHGRVVGAPGDNVLAEFPSVVDAVECAVEIQKELKTRNAGLPESGKMEFRMGVNLGDVIEDGEQILGDGVNIAARLEGLAEGGGICISGTAFDQVRNKLALGYYFLGEQRVKNIALPVRVYRLLAEPEASGKVVGEHKSKPRQWQKFTLGLVVSLLVIAAAVVIWRLYLGMTSHVEIASKEKMAFPLPDVPSIAVLPLANMSGDPKQEFLCDGITEEIITALSKVPRLFVIARTSTFTYKGKSVKIKQVSEDLGVRYVLEGSVQRSGDRIRINIQFIDALKGNHLWAESYDRALKDIFALQDEITIKILTGVQVKLGGGEVSSAQKYAEKYYKGKQGLDCYLKLMQAAGYSGNIETNILARRMIEEVIAMCPEIPMAYVQLGWTYHRDFVLGNTKSPRETIEEGMRLAQKALDMGDSTYHPHALLCMLYRDKGDYDKAIVEGERGVALNPSDPDMLSRYALILNYASRTDESIPLFQKAIRLNPNGSVFLYRDFGSALRAALRFEEAVSAYKKAIQITPDNIFTHIHLAATYTMMGREKEARAEAAEVLRINPRFSVDSYAKTLVYKDQSEADKLITALRRSGLK